MAVAQIPEILTIRFKLVRHACDPHDGTAIPSGRLMRIDKMNYEQIIAVLMSDRNTRETAVFGPVAGRVRQNFDDLAGLMPLFEV